MRYTWTPPITDLGALLSALYTGERSSKKYDADIVVNPDEILVRQYFPGKQVVCSKIDMNLFQEVQVNGYIRKKIVENDLLGLQVFTLTRNMKRLECAHQIRLTWEQAEHA